MVTFLQLQQQQESRNNDVTSSTSIVMLKSSSGELFLQCEHRGTELLLHYSRLMTKAAEFLMMKSAQRVKKKLRENKTSKRRRINVISKMNYMSLFL